MRNAIVLFHSAWRPVEALAMDVATELGARALSFERRPELAMYDLVVVGTSGPGLLDPRLGAYLLGGELRGKRLAIFSDVWPAPANAAFQAAARLAVGLGGAVATSRWLEVASGPFGQLPESDREAARAWARELKAEVPPAAYPRA